MSIGRTATIAVVIVGLLAVPASAQRRARGTRGTPSARVVRGPQFNGSVYGGYDAPLFATDTFATLQPTGQAFGGVDGGFSYDKVGRRVVLATTASASNRYFPQFTPKTQPSYGLSLSLASVARGKWSWTLSNFAQYAPYSAASLFAGAVGQNGGNFQLASGSAFQTSTIRQVNTSSALDLTYSPTRRLHFSLLGGAGTILPIDSPIARNLRLTGQGRVSYDLSRAFRGYVGYAVNENRVEAKNGVPATTYRLDGIDFGIDLNRPFQITRDTTLTVQTGLVKLPDQGRNTYQLRGNVTLEHTFLETWIASLSAQRDARFVQSYKDPVVLAGVSASTSGLLVGSLGAVLSANYSNGTIYSTLGKSNFLTYSASAQLRYDLRRNVATFLDYTAFRSEVDASAALVGYPTGQFGRYSIRGGLSLGLSPFSK
ncbi:MAG: hypothetical protein U0P30_09830 [Vicinamibacterales bacterium]